MFLISLAGFRPLTIDHDGIPTKLRPLEPPIESYCHATTPIWQRYTLPVIHDGHDSSRRRPTPLLGVRPGPWQSTPPPTTFATGTAGGTLRVPQASPLARPQWQMHHHVMSLVLLFEFHPRHRCRMSTLRHMLPSFHPDPDSSPNALRQRRFARCQCQHLSQRNQTLCHPTRKRVANLRPRPL